MFQATNQPEIIFDKKILDGFFTSFSIVLVSELFDKTFFIAAIMAMRNSRLVVFFAAISALFVMTILSAYLGSVALAWFPPVISSLISSAIMYIFAFKMLYEAYKMRPDHSEEEINDVREEIDKRKNYSISLPITVDNPTYALPTFKTRLRQFSEGCSNFFSTPFFQTLTMVLVGEWGDRSQLSTIILASHKNLLAVSMGAFLGHCVCTGLAVLSGVLISKSVSVKTVTYVGAFTFFVFASCTVFHEVCPWL